VGSGYDLDQSLLVSAPLAAYTSGPPKRTTRTWSRSCC